MDVARLKALMENVRTGHVGVEAALSTLRDLPFAEIDYATVDHHRALRQGAPEVILGPGKTAEQIAGVARELVRTGQNVIVTRLDAAQAAYLSKEIPQTRYTVLARVASIEVRPVAPLPYGRIALVCAGTADLPVAEECAEVLRAFGLTFERLYDVGGAGVHRLLSRRELFDRAALAIVVAGLEGALPCVVGGLVSIPVIAVPTSVGYGVGAGGLIALGAMLTSCAAGVTVCNIDNGFGAAFAALRILQSAPRYLNARETA
jgi:NCAIR mutase (PurE)-related protein